MKGMIIIKNIKKVCLWIMVTIIVSLMFRELFIERIFSNSISFFELNHYENRADLLNFINIIVTSIISFNVYILSKRIEEQNDVDRDKDIYESLCIVYNYLFEVIYDIKKQVFNEKENYHVLEYNSDFMKHVYNLNRDILDENDIELLRTVDFNLKNYLHRDKSSSTEGLVIKWVYKSIFDLNLKISKIDEMNNIADVELLLNPHMVLVISKLRKKLGYKYEKKIRYKDIFLNIKKKKNKIIVYKKYNDSCFIENGNGYIELYEPIFYVGIKTKYTDGAMIYSGNVYSYLSNGTGKYYYYKEDSSKGIGLNSDDLIDKTAERIRKILQTENIPVRNNLFVSGDFKNGKIFKGTMIFDDKKYQSIEINENDYNVKK